MSDERQLPRTSEEVRELVQNLTFGPPPTPEQEEALLASLPPPGRR